MTLLAFRSPALSLACLVAVSACQHEPSKINYSGMLATVTPEAWRSPGLWDFQISNEQDEPAGAVLLYLTNISVDDRSCAKKSWRKAIVVYDDLELEFDLEKQVAYSISGPWLTVNLTAASCDIGYNFVGEIDADGASGFFNLAHRFGGENLGKFLARPADDAAKVETQ